VLIYCRLIGNPKLALSLTKLLDRMVLFLAGIKIKAYGLEKIPGKQGRVYVANHRSHVDGAALFEILPGEIVFLIKKEVFKIPLVSFALRTMGMIEVDRGDHEAATASINRAVSAIQSGHSVILFPEGTRSRQDTILPFKKGAFVLAIKSGADVVPITLIGADALLKPDTLFLYPGEVEIYIHDPIPTAGLVLEDRDSLLAKAQEAVEDKFEEEKAKPAS
ncbi:MAG TPA: lysophospholipid acyltransferase family protein, partial [Acidobacteriota bacterium]|nr:lysophospholipid acyltransferase family protein [Acidobacteriota bacterium]